MKKLVIPLILILLFGGIGLLFWQQQKNPSWQIVSPLGVHQKKEKEKPLEKYTFENLKKRDVVKSEIKLSPFAKAASFADLRSAEGSGKARVATKAESGDKEEDFTAYLFSYISDGRKITGLANIPLNQNKFGSGQAQKFPVIVMFRGYVDQEIYETGVGTKRAGEFFAKNGFITLAPDFLGYGESDMPPNNVWEERFLRLTSVKDLIVSINNIKQADPEKIFIWGHSNGGLVALSILEITGGKYPTTLWAPVSQPFPYDILYYTYEFDDKGKALRKGLAEFEKDYDVEEYSFDNYLDWINAPIQVHQGTADEYVPVVWSENLVKKLKEKEKEANLYTYPGADHNMNGSWEQVVKRDLQFFKKSL